MCLVALLVWKAIIALTVVISGISEPALLEIVVLLLSIHFANWRFLRKYRRVLSPLELKWFALSCAVAFYFFDAVLPLLLGVPFGIGGLAHDLAIITVGLVINFAMVGAMVYGTVPWVSRRLFGMTA